MPKKDRMLTKRTIETYVDVLREMAKSEDRLYEVSAQLEEMKKVVRMSPGLNEVLRDDSLDEQTRQGIVNEVFKEFEPGMIGFITTMSARGDIALLPRVAELYDHRLQDEDNTVIVDVGAVIPLDDDLRDKMKTKFSAQFGKTIVLREHIDPWILGGINVRANGKRIDCCTATRLERVRTELSTVTTGGER